MINRHIYLAIALLLGPLCTTYAQDRPGLRQQAEILYKRYAYTNAANVYLRLVDRQNPRLADLERLAECYWQMNQYEAAENWYARVMVHPQRRASHRLRYGEVLKANGKYVEAKQQLEVYARDTGNREQVSLAIAGCDSAAVWMAHPTGYRLRNEVKVNTGLSEFGAYPVGADVYYVGEPDSLLAGRVDGRMDQGFLRMYTAPLEGDNQLATPVLDESGLNAASYHVGPVASTTLGDTLYVTRTHPGRPDKRERDGPTRFATSTLELYEYVRNGQGGWISQPFPYNQTDAYSVGHAALSLDGATLYFVSDKPGGFGGADIWYCTRQPDGSWGPPVNAGRTVNTAGDELFPFIAADRTLYYASDGLIGMGGLDVFTSQWDGSAWSTPRNLGYPVNSAGDDFAYLINSESAEGRVGYLSSNRRGGVGSDDIYSFTYEKPRIVVLLEGSMVDRTSNKQLAGSAVTLLDEQRQVVAKTFSGSNGTFAFDVLPNRLYTVLGQKTGYHADSAQVNTDRVVRSDTCHVVLALEPIFQKGHTFELKNIHYDFDRYEIRPDAAEVLDELARTLRDNPTLKIELASHTDSRGSDKYNLSLSQRRAQAAVDYLVSRGIARGRMVAKGYGESRLVNRCDDGVHCTQVEHQANRRTEVTVLRY